MDDLEQEQLYELEGIAALEQLSLVQDQMEQSHQIQTLEEEAQQIQEQAAEDSAPTELNDIEDDFTPQLLDSILNHMKRMQRIDNKGQSTETTGPEPSLNSKKLRKRIDRKWAYGRPTQKLPVISFS